MKFQNSIKRITIETVLSCVATKSNNNMSNCGDFFSYLFFWVLFFYFLRFYCIFFFEVLLPILHHLWYEIQMVQPKLKKNVIWCFQGVYKETSGKKWIKQHFYIKCFLLVCYIRCAKTVVTLSFPKAKIDWYKCVEPQKKLALLNMQTILKKRKACNKYFLPKLFYNHQPSGRKNVNSTTSGLHSRCLMFV